jgi:hypothetical protein
MKIGQEFCSREYNYIYSITFVEMPLAVTLNIQILHTVLTYC